MKQWQQTISALGRGAVVVRECSNDPQTKIPQVTLMRPADLGCVVNGGCCDQAVVDVPAQSYELQNSEAKQLYEALRDYYSDRVGRTEDRFDGME